jgi:antitoxin component of RelBE/YafQ-DinJ toxin-antitoxin module
MALVEQLATSLREEGRGVHALLWDDMSDLVRVLLVTHAALGDIPIEPRLVSGETKRLEEIRELIQARVAEQIQNERLEDMADDPDPPPHPLWILFLQQDLVPPAGRQRAGRAPTQRMAPPAVRVERHPARGA